MNANLMRKLKYPEAHIKMSHDKIMIYSGIYVWVKYTILYTIYFGIHFQIIIRYAYVIWLKPDSSTTRSCYYFQ